jgi:hypothetical protein
MTLLFLVYYFDFSEYKIRKNRENNLQLQLSKVMTIVSRNNSHAEEGIVQMFSLRINHPLCKFKDISEG